MLDTRVVTEDTTAARTVAETGSDYLLNRSMLSIYNYQPRYGSQEEGLDATSISDNRIQGDGGVRESFLEGGMLDARTGAPAQ